jgi:hypothetical protein
MNRRHHSPISIRLLLGTQRSCALFGKRPGRAFQSIKDVAIELGCAAKSGAHPRLTRLSAFKRRSDGQKSGDAATDRFRPQYSGCFPKSAASTLSTVADSSNINCCSFSLCLLAELVSALSARAQY